MKPKQAVAIVERWSCTRPEFDYSTVAPAVAESTRAAAGRIKAAMKASVLEIGRDLLTIKEQLEHGDFQDWIACEFGMTPRTAQNYMQAARVFGAKSEIVSHLPPTLIYQLAASSTPEPLREEIVKRFEAGERIHATEVERAVKDARKSERKSADRQKTKEQDEAKRAAFLAKLPEAERVRLLKKEHQAELKRARREAELEAESREREQEAEQRQESARQALAILQEHLGSKFARFVELATAARDWEFMDALKKAAAPPAPPPRITARQQQVRELKWAAGLFDNLEGSA